MTRKGVPPELADALPEIVAAAQRVYDEWAQDEDGFDEEMGYGGICHLIADEVCGILSNRGIDCGPVTAHVGENHVWAVAKIGNVNDEGDPDRPDAGVWCIDIPPSVYEEGGGYNWTKTPDVTFDTSDIIVTHESFDPADFERYMED